MSRLDPTLPRPDTSSLPESDLIARVKSEQDSAALVALVDRHSGMYFSVVNRYAAAYPNAIKARDLDDDKLYNFHQFILAYDATRGTKLCTFIGDRTDYLCRTMLKRDARDPISPGTYASSGCMALDANEDTYSTTNGGYVTLEDESRGVAETAESDLGLEDIRRAAGEVCHDPRFHQILQYRHFGADHATMSWRDVGAKMHLSHERVRQVYNDNIALVKAHLGVSV